MAADKYTFYLAILFDSQIELRVLVSSKLDIEFAFSIYDSRYRAFGWWSSMAYECVLDSERKMLYFSLKAKLDVQRENKVKY